MFAKRHSMSCVRVGILGCSDIARRKFIPALLSSSKGVLTAVSGRSFQKSAGFFPGVDYAVMEHEELIVAPNIDLVYISIPNHLHEKWTIRVLEQGKHVICEKPLGLSFDSVKRMLCCAESNSVFLYENLMFLQHPQHSVVKELLASGAIGRLVSLRSVFGIPEPKSGNFRLDSAQGGGAFNDLLRYPLGTALHFLKGKLQQFRGFALNRGGLNMAMHGSAVSSTAEIFTLAIVFGQQYESYYEIIGESGKIRVDKAYTPLADLTNRFRLTLGSEERLVETPAADQFQLAFDHACSLTSDKSSIREVHDRSRTIAHMADLLMKGSIHVEL